MLRTLLTPISARFSSLPSPQTANKPNDNEVDPEDFARDVLVELMRNSIDRLKDAQDAPSKLEVLVEIHRIIQEDSCTKDAFRELDGFLLLINALSTLNVGTPPLPALLQQIRLIFMIMSEAMKQHPNNSDYFSRRVGYESLSQALPPLVADPDTKLPTLGYVLSLALHDFSLSGYFQAVQSLPDPYLPDFTSKPRFIAQPGAVRVLWDLLPALDAVSRHAILKLMERISSQYHRNRAVLSNLEIVGPLFQLFVEYEKDSAERAIVQKILKRTLELGISTSDARTILQRTINEDETLNPDVLEIVRSASKGRWPTHFSFQSSAALSFPLDGIRGPPPTGITFMTWIWIERLPKESSQVIFGLRINSDWVICLSLRADGKLTFRSTGNRETAVFPNASVTKSRWVHLALVHYTHRAMNPTIRLFVDGIYTDAINWAYPKPDPSAKTASYVIGDDSRTAKMRWCLASAQLLSLPIDDNLFRFIHHLGPRYASNFQSKELVKLLTYEASTSLNIFLFNSKTIAQAPPQDLVNAIKSGLGVNESSFVFALTPESLQEDNLSLKPIPPSAASDVFSDRGGTNWVKKGDVMAVDAHSFDIALWRLGGTAVALRLVQLANNPHELSRALGIMTDSMRNSWQNSEDMERIRGYDVLGNILRSKAHLINMTGFETLFEFMGMNFRSPDHSTIVNTVAYRAIALDFILWSRTTKDIQRAHLDHFVTLADTSRYKIFNVKQRFNKMGIVRKFLFVLQTDLYQHDLLPSFLEALKSAVQAQFYPDETIKPLMSMLAANLHEERTQAGSPRSVISRIDHTHQREKAEQVLGILVSILASSSRHLQKFAIALPLTRICLLLLGERPSPAVAVQVLTLIGISISTSRTFIRKFELVSGWTVLKAVLPYSWDSAVHKAAFEILLGTYEVGDTPVVICPNVLPAILASLHRGLDMLVTNTHFSAVSGSVEASSESHQISKEEVEALLEELIRLHPSSPTFRQIFKSSQTTELFLDSYKSFTAGVKLLAEIDQSIIALMDKISHFALALALDPSVSTGQQQELFGAVDIAQAALNPDTQSTPIDPKLVPSRLFGRKRFSSGRLSVNLGERTVQKSITRILDWRKNIIISERKRLRRTVLDLQENQRQVSTITDWIKLTTNERGLWPHSPQVRLWRLDETEGPSRVRKKLEPDVDVAINSKVDAMAAPSLSGDIDMDAQSMIQVEVPPWSESYELSAADTEDQWADEVTEDKHRRVRHELEPGDVIEAVVTVARIVGVDSSPGLLIFGRTNLYFLDGLVENEEGEVIDAHDAPKRLLFIPGSVVDLDGHQGAQRWTYDQVINYTNRAFLFRDVGIEIYFRDSRSLLLVFLEKRHRQNVHQRLSSVLSSRAAADPNTPGLLKTPIFGRVGAKMLSGFRADELVSAQRKWQTREISNFTYLSILNQLSGRTPSDATQYPVFPWVIKDYTSEVLNLKSSDTFRDLTKPMGALTESRREAASSRYSNLESVDEKPFHYGTHFSSSMIVCHFLIRLAPFTNMFKTLQGGDWDLPDRLFTEIRRAYESASQDIRGDVRELIPEFYTCPEFLENLANLDFGTQVNSGEKIHDVKLPSWAKNDPLLFVTLNRRALESDFVSQNLHEWIDLIWGYKQRDPESLNVFHPLSYEGSIDLDKITDDLEREATVGIIHNFGQTPKKIFNTPHPARLMHGVSSLPLGNLYGVEEDWRLLEQSDKPVRDIARPVRNIGFDQIGDKPIAHPDGVLAVPLYSHEQVEWSPTNGYGYGTGELKVVIERKVVQVIEAVFCSCATFADSDSLVTGGEDHTVRLWRLFRTIQDPLRLTMSHIMRGHQEPIMCVAASRAWSIVVSGSKDGSAIVWDLNRGLYVTSIRHGQDENAQVHLVAVNESTGYIATCSREKLCLHTVNAREIITLDLTSSSIYPPIMSLAFLEREYSNIGLLATGGSDGTIALRTWNTDKTPAGEKAKWEFRTLRELLVRKMGAGRGRDVAVTSLRFVGESLYHAQEDGKLYSWGFPEN